MKIVVVFAPLTDATCVISAEFVTPAAPAPGITSHCPMLNSVLSVTTTVDEFEAVVPVVNPKSIAATVVAVDFPNGTSGTPGENTGTPAAVPACAVTSVRATPVVVE